MLYGISIFIFIALILIAYLYIKDTKELKEERDVFRIKYDDAVRLLNRYNDKKSSVTNHAATEKVLLTIHIHSLEKEIAKYKSDYVPKQELIEANNLLESNALYYNEAIGEHAIKISEQERIINGLNDAIDNMNKDIYSLKDEINNSDSGKYKYLIGILPILKDFMDNEDVNGRDHERSSINLWLTEDEYINLSDAEKSQLALDRYQSSNKKTNWEKGRDYETYVGAFYHEKGYEVQHFGIEEKIHDLGRDIIAKGKDRTYVIQCKCWSHQSTIYELYIYQLFGTVEEYRREHPEENVIPLFVTSTILSQRAREAAERLQPFEIRENFEPTNWKLIKCNVNSRGEKIYHLPFDPQYERTKIEKQNEYYVSTVNEAERLGFHRACKFVDRHNIKHYANR